MGGTSASVLHLPYECLVRRQLAQLIYQPMLKNILHFEICPNLSAHAQALIYQPMLKH